MTMSKNLVSVLLLCAPMLVNAHHSTALNFSQERITLEGTITELRWVNPHASFVLEVMNEDGTTEGWLVELLAKIALERGGFNFDLLQEGMVIELTGRVGYREKQLRFGEARMADGQIVRERDPTRVRPAADSPPAE